MRVLGMLAGEGVTGPGAGGLGARRGEPIVASVAVTRRARRPSPGPAGIKRDEVKISREITKLAKAGNTSQARLLAKSVVGSRKQCERLMNQKAQLAGVEMQVASMASMAAVSGAFEKSTSVMKAMGKLVKAPEMAATMRTMQAEMMKMGIIEEVVDDAMEALDDDDLEEAADEEIAMVLADLTKDIRGVVLPSRAAPAAEAAPAPAAASGRVALGAGMPPPPGGGHAGSGAPGGSDAAGGGGAAASASGSSVADDLAARLAALR